MHWLSSTDALSNIWCIVGETSDASPIIKRSQIDNVCAVTWRKLIWKIYTETPIYIYKRKDTLFIHKDTYIENNTYSSEKKSILHINVLHKFHTEWNDNESLDFRWINRFLGYSVSRVSRFMLSIHSLD